LKGNKNMMPTTSITPQGSHHFKDTNLRNEKKKTKPSTPKYLTKILKILN
jgi:hypothetical protein